jgi:hypothetical protein
MAKKKIAPPPSSPRAIDPGWIPTTVPPPPPPSVALPPSYLYARAPKRGEALELPPLPVGRLEPTRAAEGTPGSSPDLSTEQRLNAVILAHSAHTGVVFMPMPSLPGDTSADDDNADPAAAAAAGAGAGDTKDADDDDDVADMDDADAQTADERAALVMLHAARIEMISRGLPPTMFVCAGGKNVVNIE